MPTILLFIAAGLFIIGLVLFITGFLSDTDLGTKSWGMLCFILSAVLILVDKCIKNPQAVSDFLNSFR